MTEKFKSLVSDRKSGWKEKAEFRQKNQDWLDISFSISVKILSVLRANKKIGTFPKNQKELAEVLDCTPQYVNKLLKGREKLNIETISKIQNALNFLIIDSKLSRRKVEIIAKTDEIFNKPKSISNRNYKKLDKVISFNFVANKNSSGLNEYKQAINE